MDYYRYYFFPGENWFCMKGKHLSLIVMERKTALVWLAMSKTVASVGAEVCQGRVFHTVARLWFLKMLIVMKSDEV